MSKPRELPTNKSEAEDWLLAAQAYIDRSCPECDGEQNCKGDQGAITAKTLRVLYDAGYAVRAELEHAECLDIMLRAMLRAANWRD